MAQEPKCSPCASFLHCILECKTVERWITHWKFIYLMFEHLFLSFFVEELNKRCPRDKEDGSS